MGRVYEEYYTYFYDGPVKEFDRVIAENWCSTTRAPTEKKARSNLTYQFKKQFNRAPMAKITLPGPIKLIG